MQYITGHGRDGKLPDDIDWASLADPAVTTIVYMPVKTLPALVAKACAAGLDPATPAVAVAQATRADERTIAGNIAELPALLAADALSGPVVVMIGKVFAGYAADRAGDMPHGNSRMRRAVIVHLRTSSSRALERRLFQAKALS